MTDSARRIVLRSCALIFVPSFASSIAAVCEAQEVSAPAIKVDVSRVNVGVVATDPHGNFVRNLQKSDFHVLDNGVEQPITGFLANDDPAQVVLMLECGPSMYLFGKESIQKADALITNLAPNDRVAIVCYSSSAQVLFELSENKPAARLALRELDFNSGFAELNLSRSLLEVLAWLSTVPGKKTVVLISSGVDSSPPDSQELFRKNISASDVRVLAVSTSFAFKKFPRKHKRDLEEREARQKVEEALREADSILRSLAASTGGHAYFSKSSKDYVKTYAEIAQIVRHEYNLAFTPPTPDGKLHTLTVTANHAFRIDHRQAYLAPGASAN